jgi:hypothetical protein
MIGVDKSPEEDNDCFGGEKGDYDPYGSYSEENYYR